jgi:hypothetical protein
VAAEQVQAGLPIEYLPAAQNLGPAGGIALGMEHVLRTAHDLDWVVTLDDDDPPRDREVLASLQAFASEMRVRDPRTGAVGLVGARLDRRTGALVRVADGELEGPVAVDYIGGNHFPFVLVRAIRDAGAFRPDLFFGFDDLEFGLRLRARGYRVYADGDRWRRHRGLGGRLGLDVRPSWTVGDSTWRRYYSLRNAIWILRTNGWRGAALRVSLVHGLGKPLANLMVSPGAARSHLAMNWAACRDGWTGRLGRTVEPGIGRDPSPAGTHPGASTGHGG